MPVLPFLALNAEDGCVTGGCTSPTLGIGV